MAAELDQPKPGTKKPCSACDGGDKGELQSLRKCGHAVCSGCIFEHLKKKILGRKQVAIGCPAKECKKKIHENDIRIALRPNESLPFDSPASCERRCLQYTHDEKSIVSALKKEGEEYRRCPLCTAVYTSLDEMGGCHFVECANLRCKCTFCWQCGAVVSNFNHFIGEGSCQPTLNDVYWQFWPVRVFLLGDRTTLLCLSPFAIGLLLFVFPVSTALLLPFFVCRHLYTSATRRTTLVLMDEYAFLIVKMVLAVLLLLPVGMLLGGCSCVSAIIMTILYIYSLSESAYGGPEKLLNSCLLDFLLKHCGLPRLRVLRRKQEERSKAGADATKQKPPAPFSRPLHAPVDPDAFVSDVYSRMPLHLLQRRLIDLAGGGD